jgi:hypothetical protein
VNSNATAGRSNGTKQGLMMRYVRFFPLSYLVVFPAGNNRVLLPMLAFCSIWGFHRFLSRPAPALDPRTLILAFAAPGAWIVALGLIRSTPGWADVAVPLVGGPICWFLISQLFERDDYGRIIASLAIGTIIVSLAALLLAVGIEVPIVVSQSGTAYARVSSGFGRVNLTGLTSLIATVPILALHAARSRLRPGVRSDRAGTRRLTSNDSHSNAPSIPTQALSGDHHRLTIVAIGASLAALLVAGRQGLVAVVLLIPLAGRMALSLAQVRTFPVRRLLRVAIPLLLLAAPLATFVGVDLGTVPSRLTYSLGLSEEEVNAATRSGRLTRDVQSSSYWLEIERNPVLGYGGGAVNERRNSEERRTASAFPWRAELQYHLLAYEGGVVAILAYILVTLAVMGRVRIACRNSHQPCVEFGSMACAAIILAIVTASNPYVRGVGQQWALFLPMAVLPPLCQRHLPRKRPDRTPRRPCPHET